MHSLDSITRSRLPADAAPGGAGTHFEVVIAGAGPVGALLACLLGSKGVRVLLLEKRTALPAHSMAIGITPPSLHILARLGLADKFIAEGVKVLDCFIHGPSGCLGCVSFRGIQDQHRFVLSLQQAATISILRDALKEYPTVTFQPGVEVMDIEQRADDAVVMFGGDDNYPPQCVTAGHVVACDGARSQLRGIIGEEPRVREYDRHFVMGDFIDRTGLGDEAHLFFMADGSVESFPLPAGHRRWIVQTDEPLQEIPSGLIGDIVLRRTGVALLKTEQLNASSFTPRRFNCARYHRERVILCGDAAHGMSPVGGQGMNTGFADAEFLAEVLVAVTHRGAAPGPLLAAYQRYRRKAAGAAISRAGRSMWLGTMRGKRRSVLRDFFIRNVLCKWPVSRRTGAFYAMLTIPYNTLKRVPIAELAPSFS